MKHMQILAVDNRTDSLAACSHAYQTIGLTSLSGMWNNYDNDKRLHFMMKKPFSNAFYRL
jgi:hypothetical protein